MQIPNLRSPNVAQDGLLYFPRMLDKIRLHAAGQLPVDYIENLGAGFDERTVSFLRVSYADVVSQTLTGASDADVLRWCHEKGRKPTEEEVEVWNEFMRKRGWNDAGSDRLASRKSENGFTERADIQTFFDFIDADEGRK